VQHENNSSSDFLFFLVSPVSLSNRIISWILFLTKAFRRQSGSEYLCSFS
jgi:hypothetical protein